MKSFFRLRVFIILLVTAGIAHADYQDQLDAWQSFTPVNIVTPSTGDTAPTPPSPSFPAEVQAPGAAGHENGSGAIFLRQEISAKKRQQIAEAALADDATAALLATDFNGATVALLAQFRSPAVTAARKKLAAAGQAISQATYLDRILARYRAFTGALMTGIGPMRDMESPGNSFPFPGITSLKGKIARLETAEARINLEKAMRDAATDGRVLFGKMYELFHQEKILAEMEQLFEKLRQVATTRYENGSGQFHDVVAVRIRLEKAREKLATVRRMIKTRKEDLRALLALPTMPHLARPSYNGLTASPPPPANLEQQALQSRQELRRLDIRIARMEAMLEMGETMIGPGFSQGLADFSGNNARTAGTNAMTPAFAKTAAADRGKGLPVAPFTVTNDAYLKRLLLETDALRARRRQLAENTRALVHQRWFELDRALRQAQLSQETIVPLAEAAADVTRRGYENGQIPFRDAIDAMADLLEARLTEKNRQGRIFVTHALLEQAVGVPVTIAFSPSM